MDKTELTPPLAISECSAGSDPARDVDESMDPLSVRAAALTLSQNILGAGVLSLPYAFRSAGIIAGGGLLAFIYVLSVLSMLVLVLIGNHLGTFSYKDAATKTIGERWATVVEAWVLLFNLGLCVGYVLLVGTFAFEIVNGLVAPSGGTAGGAWPTAQGWSAIIVLLVCWPLSCSPSLGFLSWTSFLGISATLFATVVVVVRYSDGTYRDPSYDRNDMVAFNIRSFGNCFPILVGAYGAHFNIPRLYREVAPEAEANGSAAFANSAAGKEAFRRMGRVVMLALTFSTLVYGTVGTAVYATFGAGTADNFAKNFKANDSIVIVVRLLMSISICVSFPIVIVSARGATFNLFLQRHGWRMTRRLRVLLSTVLSGIVLVLGIAAGDSLGTVLDYTGAIFGTPVCFVAPAVIYLCMPRVQQQKRWRAFCLVSSVAGAVLALLGVVAVSMTQSSS